MNATLWCEKAFPLDFVMVAIAQAKPDSFEKCMAGLTVIYLFFCLRSFKYTNTNSHRHMTRFRFQDTQFNDANGVIPPDAAANMFLAASAVTLLLETQDNCVRGESSTTEATGLLHGETSPSLCTMISPSLEEQHPTRHSYLCLLCFGGRRPKICDRDKYRGAPPGHS